MQGFYEWMTNLVSLHESVQIGSEAPRTVCVVCSGRIRKWFGSTVKPILRTREVWLVAILPWVHPGLCNVAYTA